MTFGIHIFLINYDDSVVYLIDIHYNGNQKEGDCMAKTANVLARVEPEVKEEAEKIMNQIGVPASVVINMLYKQIIYTRGIPFPLTLNHEPLARDEMSDTEFNAMMEKGLEQAKAGKGKTAAEVGKDLKKKMQEWQE